MVVPVAIKNHPEAAAGDAVEQAVADGRWVGDTRKRLLDDDDDDEPAAATSDEQQRRIRRRRAVVAVDTTSAQSSNGNQYAEVAVQTANQAERIQTLSDRLEAGFACLGAQFANLPRRARHNTGTWTPLHAGPNPVGLPPAVYPASPAAVLALTGAQITALKKAFNLPAGHFDGATLTDRRRAVQVYVAFG